MRRITAETRRRVGVLHRASTERKRVPRLANCRYMTTQALDRRRTKFMSIFFVQLSVEFAALQGPTTGQLAIARVLARQPAFVPVIGAETPAQLDDALAALERPS